MRAAEQRPASTQGRPPARRRLLASLLPPCHLAIILFLSQSQTMNTDQRPSLNEMSLLSRTSQRPATEALNQQLDQSTRCKRRKLHSSTASKVEPSHNHNTLSMTDLHMSLSFSEHSDQLDESLNFPQIDFSVEDEGGSGHFLNSRKRSITSLSIQHEFGGPIPHGMVRSRTIRSSIYRMDASLDSQ